MGQMISLVGDVGIIIFSIPILLILLLAIYFRPHNWPRPIYFVYRIIIYSLIISITIVVLLCGHEIFILRDKDKISYQELFAQNVTYQLGHDIDNFIWHIRVFRQRYYSSGRSTLTHDYFNQWASEILEFSPSISSVQWLPRVNSNQIQRLSHQMNRRLGNFRFVPSTDILYSPGEEVVTYFPICFDLHRSNVVGSELGLDQSANPSLRYYVLEMSNRPDLQNEPFISGSNIVGQYTFFIPIFRPTQISSLEGFIAINFDFKAFIRDLLESRGYEDLFIEVSGHILEKNGLETQMFYQNFKGVDKNVIDDRFSDHSSFFNSIPISWQNLTYIEMWLPKSLQDLQDSIRGARHSND